MEKEKRRTHQLTIQKWRALMLSSKTGLARGKNRLRGENPSKKLPNRAFSRSSHRAGRGESLLLHSPPAGTASTQAIHFLSKTTWGEDKHANYRSDLNWSAFVSDAVCTSRSNAGSMCNKIPFSSWSPMGRKVCVGKGRLMFGLNMPDWSSESLGSHNELARFRDSRIRDSRILDLIPRRMTRFHVFNFSLSGLLPSWYAMRRGGRKRGGDSSVCCSDDLIAYLSARPPAARKFRDHV